MSIRLTIGAACLLATTATACADILWGVNGHPIASYPGVPIEWQLDYIEDLGMKSYRVDVPDADADTIELLSTLVRGGKERGIEILPVIVGGFDLDKASAEVLYRKAHELAVELGSRFKDDIRVWELGNEMENYALIKPCETRDDGTQYPCEWGIAGGPSPLDYYGPRWAKVSAVLKGLSDGMTGVDPTIRKAMGTAGWGHTGAFERMQQDGIEWDISVWHMYGGDPEPAFEKLASYGKPIWVTEFNNPYGSQRGESQQAEGLVHTMKRLLELQDAYKVEAAHIYELLDESYWAPDFEAYMGLVRLVGSVERGWTAGGPKPAYFAAKDLIRGPQPPAVPRRDCDLADGDTYGTLAARQAAFAHCLILGRKAGAEEIDQWSANLENGSVNVPNMMLDLMRSREFMKRYSPIGLSDRDYVNFLYRLLADRDGDGYGLDTYASQLRDGTMTREAIAFGMITSSEFNSKHSVHLAADPAATGTVAAD
ncbi:DUF4214 domain-containing protein [Mesorhizobium sp. WSM2239]|uniref:DUF4214 domain-containing protein n=2 Tax=unclassified Mesorhizobium TaxID=325217 RepID=A0AAU8DHR0_9HYPH